MRKLMSRLYINWCKGDNLNKFNVNLNIYYITSFIHNCSNLAFPHINISCQPGHWPSLIRVMAVYFIHADSEDSEQSGQMAWQN